MDRQDDKWVDLMREKLENYSPKYNAAHWAGLAEKLPPAGAEGHGWLWSKLLPYSRIIIISAVAVLTTIVSLVYFDSSKTEKEQITVIQQKETDVVTDQEAKQSLKNLQEQTEQNRETIENAKGAETVVSQKEQEVFAESKNVEETAKKQNENISEREVAVDAGTAVSFPEQKEYAGVLPVDVKNDQEVERKEQMNAALTAAAVSEESGQKDYSGAESSLTSEITAIEDSEIAAMPGKMKSGGLKTVKPVKAGGIKVPKKRYDQNSGVEMKNIPVRYERPLYIGLSYSGAYANGEVWFTHKYQSRFGISIEKYIFRNFSVSFAPEVSFNSIYEKQDGTVNATTSPLTTGTPLTSDSLGYTVFSDSLDIPVLPDSSDVYPGKLSYLDLPLIFTYDVLSDEKYRLSASAGVVSRYSFSMSKDDLSKEMNDMNNRFSFMSAGRVSLRYNRFLTEKLFFEIEPFWEFPLKNETESFNRSFYGFNLHLKFRVR